MRTRRCTSRVIAGRLAKAEEFLRSAEFLADDDHQRNAASSLYIDAGIAAADVLCCKRLGEHARGQDHNDAVKLLGQVSDTMAKHLRALLTNKSRVSYSEQALPTSEFKRVQRAATQLVDAAKQG